MAAANLGRHCLLWKQSRSAERRSFKEKMDMENESTD